MEQTTRQAPIAISKVMDHAALMVAQVLNVALLLKLCCVLVLLPVHATVDIHFEALLRVEI
jgi:hypothetical protein